MTNTLSLKPLTDADATEGRYYISMETITEDVRRLRENIDKYTLRNNSENFYEERLKTMEELIHTGPDRKTDDHGRLLDNGESLKSLYYAYGYRAAMKDIKRAFGN